MTDRYFQKFPTMVYGDKVCLDITRRVKVNNNPISTPNLFYPYELKDGLRSDLLANAYYEDPEMDWLIYLNNGIIDPYYGWYLDQDDFNSHIKKVYGSIEAAQEKIKFYRLNWTADDIDITADFWENQLPQALKKYYSPKFGPGSRVISYSRRAQDWTANTNKIIQFDIELVGDDEFEEGEIVDIKDAGNNVVGGCEVVTANSSVVMAQHISGNTSANNYLYGETSGANGSIDTTTVLQVNISDDEFVYWSAVSYFDYEREINESRKFVSLLDANWAIEASEEVRLKLKEE